MMVHDILTGHAYSRIVRDPITHEPELFELVAPTQTQVDNSDPENLVVRYSP